MSGPYQIIYADPPWSYNDRGIRGASDGHYPTMPLANIQALPVASELAADDCGLFLWATYPMLREAMATISAWGFDYVTTAFVWIKLTQAAPGKEARPHTGLGHWTRGTSEPCLFARRGKPRRQDTTAARSLSQLVFEPRGRHSAKPPIVRDHIVALLGDLPRIELFARDTADGWDCWGNEISTSTPAPSTDF